MIAVVSISLSLIVILGALALLAKTKKDDLGKGYVFASYATLSLGVLLLLGSVGGAMMRCGHNKGHNSCYASSQCSSHEGGNHAKMCKSHAGQMSCGTSCASSGASCAWGSGHSCDRGGHAGSCSSMKGKKHRKMHYMHDGEEKNIEVEVKIDGDQEEDEE